MSYQPSEKLKTYVKNGDIKILGITGKMFSGKDTVAEFIHFAFRNSRITSFAYPMKQMMIDYFGFTYARRSEQNAFEITFMWIPG